MIALFSRNLSSLSRKQTDKSNIPEQYQNMFQEQDCVTHDMGNIRICFFLFFFFLRCKHKVLQKYFLKSPFDGKKLSCIGIASLKMSKNVYSRLVYCKISDDIAVDSESELLLPRAARGFTVKVDFHCCVNFTCVRA